MSLLFSATTKHTAGQSLSPTLLLLFHLLLVERTGVSSLGPVDTLLAGQVSHATEEASAA